MVGWSMEADEERGMETLKRRRLGRVEEEVVVVMRRGLGLRKDGRREGWCCEAMREEGFMAPCGRGTKEEEDDVYSEERGFIGFNEMREKRVDCGVRGKDEERNEGRKKIDRTCDYFKV